MQSADKHARTFTKLVVPRDMTLGFQPPVRSGLYPQFQDAVHEASSKKTKLPDDLAKLQLHASDVEDCIKSLRSVFPELDKDGFMDVVELVTVLVNDLALSSTWSDASGQCWSEGGAFGKRGMELSRFAPLVPCTIGLMSAEGNCKAVSCAFFFDVHYFDSKLDGAYMPFADMRLQDHVEILRMLRQLPRARSLLDHPRRSRSCEAATRFMEHLDEHVRDDEMMRRLVIVLVPVWHRFYFTMMSSFSNLCDKIREQEEAHLPIITHELLDKTESQVQTIVDYILTFFKMGPLVMKTFSVLTRALLHSEPSQFDKGLELFRSRALPERHEGSEKRECRTIRDRGCAYCGTQFHVGENDCDVLADHTGSLPTFNRMAFGDPAIVRVLADRVQQAGETIAKFQKVQQTGGDAAVGVKLPFGLSMDTLQMRKLVWTNLQCRFQMSSPRLDHPDCAVASEEAIFLRLQESFSTMLNEDLSHEPIYTTASIFKAAQKDGQIPLYMPREPCLDDVFQLGFILNFEINNGMQHRPTYMADVWDDTLFGGFGTQTFVKNPNYATRTNLLFHIATPIAGVPQSHLNTLEGFQAARGVDDIFTLLSQKFVKSVPASGGDPQPRNASNPLQQLLTAKWILVRIGPCMYRLPGGAHPIPDWAREFLTLLQRDEGVYLNVVSRATEERVAAFDKAVARATAVLSSGAAGPSASFEDDAGGEDAGGDEDFWASFWTRPQHVSPETDRLTKLQMVKTAKATLTYLSRDSPTAARNYIGLRESIWYFMWGLYGAGRDWTEDPEGSTAEDPPPYKSQGHEFPGLFDEKFYQTRLDLDGNLMSMQECCKVVLGIYASGGMIDSNLCPHCKTPALLDLTQHPAPLDTAWGVHVPFKPAIDDPEFFNPHPLPQWACACVRKPRTIKWEDCYNMNAVAKHGVWLPMCGSSGATKVFPTVDDIDWRAGANQFLPPDSIPLPNAHFLPPEPVLVQQLKEVFWEGVSFEHYQNHVAIQQPEDDLFLIIARCARMLLPRRMRIEEIRFKPSDSNKQLCNLFISGDGLRDACQGAAVRPAWKDYALPTASDNPTGMWWSEQMKRLVCAVNTMRMDSSPISTRCHLCKEGIGKTFFVPRPGPASNVAGLDGEQPCSPFRWECKGYRKPCGMTVTDWKKLFYASAESKFLDCEQTYLGESVLVTLPSADVSVVPSSAVLWNFSLCIKIGFLFYVPATPNSEFKKSDVYKHWKRYEWERVWNSPTIRGEADGARIGLIPGFVCCGKVHKHRCSECEGVGPVGKGMTIFLPND